MFATKKGQVGGLKQVVLGNKSLQNDLRKLPRRRRWELIEKGSGGLTTRGNKKSLKAPS